MVMLPMEEPSDNPLVKNVQALGRGVDPAIQALAKLDRILAALEPPQQLRCLEWLAGVYGADSRFIVADEAKETTS